MHHGGDRDSGIAVAAQMDEVCASACRCRWFMRRWCGTGLLKREKAMGWSDCTINYVGQIGEAIGGIIKGDRTARS
jgi:hypothetical protein